MSAVPSDIEGQAERLRHRLGEEQRRELIMDRAESRLRRNGVNGFTVDQVVRDVGLGKASVYRLYAGRDDLLCACLARLSERELNRLRSLAGRTGAHHGRALYALVDETWRAVREPGFAGCLFQRVSLEVPDPQHPARRVVHRHSLEVQRLFTELASDLVGEYEGPRLADHLIAQVEAMRVTAVSFGPEGPCRAALLVARDLIRAAA